MTSCVFDCPNKCIALIEKNCFNCSFAKTKEQLKSSRHKTTKRIKSLPEAQMYHIIHKYYYGKLI